MKKFGINYSRPFPDHRVPYDYKFDQELTKSPSTYFRMLKHSFNSTGVAQFHVWLTVAGTMLFFAAGCWKYYGGEDLNVEINKKQFPGFKYALLSNRGGYGAYDNVLQKFEREKGGLRDLAFDE